MVETECGHIFCENCLTSWLQKSDTCPVDRHNIENKYHPMHRARRKILALQVECPQNCSKKFTIKDLEKHLYQSCSQRQVSCGVCNEKMIAAELKDHTEKAFAHHLQVVYSSSKDVTANCDRLEKELKENNDFMKKENKSLHTKLDKNKENIDFLTKENNSLRTKLDELEKKFTNLEEKQCFIGSRIMSKDQCIQLRDMLKTFLPHIKPIQIFIASQHGFSASQFHKLCDNQGPTLVIISANNQIFGGFAGGSWTSSDTWGRCGKTSYLFSLTTRKIWKCKDDTYELRFLHSYGPTFGGNHDLHISDQCDAHTYSYSTLGNSYEGSGTILVGVKSTFKVDDYEVFRF